MQRHLYLVLVGYWDDFFQEVLQIFPYLLFAYRLVATALAGAPGIGVALVIKSFEIEFTRYGAASFGQFVVGAYPAEADHPVVADHVKTDLVHGLHRRFEVLYIFVTSIGP